MPNEPPPASQDLFSAMDARGGAAAAVSGPAWLQAMLDVEAALARAGARSGSVPPEAAETIAATCDAGRFDHAEIVRGTGDSASPVVPLVRMLRAAVGGDAARYVHQGATSQDVIDSAAMLVSKRALEPMLRDTGRAAGAVARLADEHRATPMAGRTLMQQAAPIAFGMKAAGWLSGIDEARTALAEVRDGTLAVQLAGPVGSGSPAVAALVARELDLAEPTLPWHTVRVRPVKVASAVGSLAGVLAKVAGDILLLAQNEIGELRESGGSDRGGSSAMSHKRNPVASVAVISCTERVPGLVATMFAAMPQENERAAGRWQAEWGTLSDLLRLTGSAAAWSADLLGGLEVHPDRMRANLERLADAGVQEAARPDDHLGAADELIDRALAAHRQVAP